jgi:hypothetical protein
MHSPNTRRRASIVGAAATLLAGNLLGGCWMEHSRGSRSDGAVDAFVPASDARTLDAGRTDTFERDASLPDAFLPDAFDPFDAPRSDASRPRIGCGEAADQFIGTEFEFDYVAAIDLDGDGVSELIALSGFAVRLFRWMGGALVEVWASGAAGSERPLRGAIGGDMDADGDLDVIVPGEGLEIFENRGGELFESRVASSGPNSSGVEADDLDGDGDGDLVAGGGTADEGADRVAIQNADGTFIETTLDGPASYSFAQMLHRGGVFPQLVVTAGDHSRLFQVRERVDGVWRSVMAGETPDRLSGLAAADFDGDGFEDFVVTRSRALGPVFYRQRPGSVFELALEGNPAIGWAWATAVHDIDADGDPDLLIGAFSGTLWLYESTGDFAFVEHATSCRLTSEGISALYSMTAGDFDGDGLIDMAIATNVSLVVFLDVQHRLFGL